MNAADHFFITSNCAGVPVYSHLARPYDTPFLGSLFEDDEQFCRFCMDYDRYIAMEPTFGEPLLPVLDGIDAPVMFLGEVEIHWIHEPDRDALLAKYCRRLERGRGKTPVFFWSDSQFYQDRTEVEREELISRFLSIPEERRVFFRAGDVPAWAGEEHTNRRWNAGRAQPLWWANQTIFAGLMIEWLKAHE